MTREVECPTCGKICAPEDIEKDHDPDLPMPVARRSTDFGGNITSLNELENFMYVATLPCGHEIITVN